MRAFEAKKKFTAVMKKDSEKIGNERKMFLAASDKNLVDLILLALDTAESNKLSLDLFILYINQ